jgi:UDP-N-acetylglucosamine:LPS N-acetylglucosamine transferase
MNNKTIFITHAERNIKQFINFFEAYKILKKYKPKVILSTGASPIVPFSILSILIFKSKIIYIETLTSVTKPSLTGKIMYYLADNFYYRWTSLNKYFPKGLLVERF